MAQNFIHLRLHTEFSLSDGLIVIPALMEKLIAFGMPAVAITDQGNLYATVKFYQAAYAAGIKPIIGVDLRLSSDKNPKEPTRFTLLCQNNIGYKNLLKLVSRSYLAGQMDDQPIVKKAWLEENAEGLIALSGAQEGEIGQALLRQDQAALKSSLSFWQTLFPNRFYIELSRVGKPEEKNYIPAALKLAESQHLPVVATNDVRYLKRDDFEAHEARVCIQESLTLNDPQRPRRYTDQQYLRSQQEMETLFADIPEALINTVEIAKRCNVTFKLHKSTLPHFDVPAGYTTESYLSAIAKEGLQNRLNKMLAGTPSEDQRNTYDQRLERELAVINKMGFAGYFLIVADFTKWAKENHIPVGPGRGSGSGSLVAYALNITDLDPITFDLLFERFLNPERVSMPDFDIDFCMEGRDRVIQYVIDKHGQESVAQIITYGTMAAKAVVRDVGRVLGFTYGFVDKIAKLIPFELGMTLAKAMQQEPLLRERYEQEEEVRILMDLARKLEGITRNVGKHAGGIVIAPGKLTDFVPLYCEPNESAHPVTQFDKDDVEAVGLVKFDFLGLKTLTIIDRALRVINQTLAERGESAVDITLIPLNDVKTFSLLKACKTTAVFQLESTGMRDLIKRLEPDCFEELIALVALFRPGPLQAGAADDFINRKHGRAKVVYPHPRLEAILGPTYGTIVYQEQVMKIAQVLAGYTLGAADILRKAMGKKKPQEMAKQRKIFCQGAMERGVNAEVASHIFDLMEKFAGYGFNKSHSAPYALIAYQTAWLKVHYPAAYMAAVLSSDMDRTDKVIVMLEECKALGLQVSPPDINRSEYFFTLLDDKHIMYGLGAIKGMGLSAIESIVSARRQDGPFKDLYDFCQRIDLRKVNRRALEALIKSGCFDSLCSNRASCLASLNAALQHAEQALQNQTYGQHDLLSTHSTSVLLDYVEMPPWSEELRLANEKDTLGFYLTGHPVTRYLKELAHFTTCRIAELNLNQHQSIRAAGIITNVRTRRTKRGDRFGILTIDDGTAQIEAVCFAELFQKYRSVLQEDQMIVVEGEVNFDEFNNNLRLVSREIYTFEQARQRFAKYLQIKFASGENLDLDDFKHLLTQHLGGSCPVVMHYICNNIQANIKLGKNWLVKPTEALLTLIKEQFRIEDVELMY